MDKAHRSADTVFNPNLQDTGLYLLKLYQEYQGLWRNFSMRVDIWLYKNGWRNQLESLLARIQDEIKRLPTYKRDPRMTMRGT